MLESVMSIGACLEQKNETFEELVNAGKFHRATSLLKEIEGQEELERMTKMLYTKSKDLVPNSEARDFLLEVSRLCIPKKLNFLDFNKRERKGINTNNGFLYLLFAARLPLSMTGKAKLEKAIDYFIAQLINNGEDKFSVDWIYSEADQDEIEVLKQVVDKIFKNEHGSFRLMFETLGILKVGEIFIAAKPSEQIDILKSYFSSNHLLKIESWNNKVHAGLITKIEQKLTRAELDKYLGIDGTRGRT